MTDKEKTIKELKEALDSLDITNKYRLNLIRAIEYLQEEPVSNPIDFEKELYKAFGQVKDFTLGMRIAKWFYDMGKNSQELVSEDLEEAVNTYIGYPPEVDECSSVYGKRQAFKAGAKWQKQQDSIPSKDLEELIDTLSKRYPEVSFAKLSRIAVRVAKWQMVHP